MPWQLRLFMMVPMLVLAVRVLVSRDPRWKRIAAAAFVLAAAVAQPLLMRAVEAGSPQSAAYDALQLLHMLAFYGAGLVLIVWAIRSRDPIWQRLVSFAVGLFGLGPVIVTLAGSAPAMFAPAHQGAN